MDINQKSVESRKNMSSFA